MKLTGWWKTREQMRQQLLDWHDEYLPMLFAMWTMVKAARDGSMTKEEAFDKIAHFLDEHQRVFGTVPVSPNSRQPRQA
jgi:hypothetical protein